MAEFNMFSSTAQADVALVGDPVYAQSRSD
jgi:hypothetical protein